DEKAAKLPAVEHAYVRVSLFPLLIGRRTLGFGGKAFHGSIDGTVAEGADRTVSVSLDGISPGEVPYLRDVLKLPMQGSMTGSIDLKMREKKLAETDGTV